jgi:hypothetical protein
MKIQTTFVLTTAIALPLIIAYSQQASAQDPDAPSPSAYQSAVQPLSPEASFFYDQLAPYGQWLWVDPYGWVWSPNNVAPGWRPYTDGSWAYSDAGWTWVSDVSWGWAPFHYGRWFFHEHRGWCWVPGSEWAPAWVAWHWGDGYCGWAPMPPLVAWETSPDWDAIIPSFGWCFVAHTDFRRAHLRDHIVLAARNLTLLRETRNVTRFELRNKALVNLSITAEQVEKVTGRPVRHFNIAEINSPVGDHGSLRGKTEIGIYRPVVRETKVVTPLRGIVTANPAVTFDQLRREEAAHRELEAQQARERAALERMHDAELHTPPRGLSAPQLMERHQAEHREFNEHVNRQNQVFEYRQQLPSPPAPHVSSVPAPSPQRSGTGSGNRR